MKSHYEPYMADDVYDSEKFICGTPVGQEAEVSGDWRYVDCKRCLKAKERINEGIKSDEEQICKQMGEEVAFYQQLEKEREE